MRITRRIGSACFAYQDHRPRSRPRAYLHAWWPCWFAMGYYRHATKAERAADRTVTSLAPGAQGSRGGRAAPEQPFISQGISVCVIIIILYGNSSDVPPWNRMNFILTRNMKRDPPIHVSKAKFSPLRNFSDRFRSGLFSSWNVINSM